jgi:hypothetical protein
MKKIIAPLFLILTLTLVGCTIIPPKTTGPVEPIDANPPIITNNTNVQTNAEVQTTEEYCIKTETGEKMSFADAQKIAEKSECTASGQLLANHFCNANSGTWWINLSIEKKGCAPACVIEVATKKAEINWRCTGLILPE